MKFVTFYTGHYIWDAEQLVKSFTKLKMTNFIAEEKPRLGSWEHNTQYKAPFILEKLSQNDAVVWTDADSRIRQVPTLFDTLDCDVAFFHFKKNETQGFILPKHSILSQELIDRDGYLQSGTMYFNNTPRTIALLNKWIELNEQDNTQWDQWTLQMAASEIEGLVVQTLPPEYVWVDGNSNEVFGNRRPVIEHLQASRRFKSIIR